MITLAGTFGFTSGTFGSTLRPLGSRPEGLPMVKFPPEVCVILWSRSRNPKISLSHSLSHYRGKNRQIKENLGQAENKGKYMIRLKIYDL